MTIFLVILACVSAVATIVLVGQRVLLIRTGQVTLEHEPAFQSVIQGKIDFISILFVLALRDAIKFFCLEFLLLVRRVILLVRQGTMVVEHKCSRIINVVRGQSLPLSKGATSFFLREIKDHQDTFRSNLS